MLKLFISYRRSDSEGYAGRLYDNLVQHFDESNVFIDIAGITPGDNFVDILKDKLATTDVVLALIGRTWLSTSDNSGRRRIDNTHDFVRMEIASALSKKIHVIPLLVQNSQMPTADQLPEDLRLISQLNAINLNHATFNDDVKRLVTFLQENEQLARSSSSRAKINEFQDAIYSEYSDAFSMSISSDLYKLQIHFGSHKSPYTFARSHMIKDIIVTLIENADTGFWVKNDSDLRPEDFWKAILDAVADSVSYELPFEGEFTRKQLLQQLLSWYDEDE